MLGAEAKVAFVSSVTQWSAQELPNQGFAKEHFPHTFPVDAVHYAAFFKSHLSMPSLRRDGFIEMNSEELCDLFCVDSLVFFEEF